MTTAERVVFLFDVGELLDYGPRELTGAPQANNETVNVGGRR